MQQTARTEFAQAIRAIAQERKLDPEIIMSGIKEAIVAAYKKDAREQNIETEGFEFDVEMNPVSGETHIFSWPIETPDDKKEVTPPGFGRIAAQTAKQVIHQKIREAEKGAVMDEFSGRIGTLISGLILRFEGANVRVDLGRTEGIMPVEERVPNERLNPSQRATFLIKEIREGAYGKQVILSRASDLFVTKLFEREVPEMASHAVEVKAIARDPGVRTKMAVFSSQSGVDPVGSCVGQKGVRVQAVTNELNGERVDIIQYTENIEDLVIAALSPAEQVTVRLDKEFNTAIVTVPEDQLSLAIGKDGQNARLASKLTGWKIKIEGAIVEKTPEVVEEQVEAESVEKSEEAEETVQAESEDSPQEPEEPKTAEEKVEQKDAQVKDDSETTSDDVKNTDNAPQDSETEEVKESSS